MGEITTTTKNQVMGSGPVGFDPNGVGSFFENFMSMVI